MKKLSYADSSLASPESCASRESRDDRALGTIWKFVWIFLIFRLWYASAHELAADEAVYWSWSRHLAGGYLDHPSMIAFMIRLSTAIFGSTEFGTRFFCPLLATGSLIIMLRLANRVLQERRAVVWVGVIWLTSPLLAALGTIATPDTPSIFFSLCALGCVILMFQDDDSPQRPAREAGLWLAFGVFCGLAMWSKYTTVLLPLSVGLALLTSPWGRRHLRRPWPWLSAIPAVAVFMPVLLWNKEHDWASFRYQLHHGLAGAVKAKPLPQDALHQVGRAIFGLLRYSGNELLVWTPVLMVIGVIILVHFWRRYRALLAVDRMLLWTATVPLVFFAVASTRAQPEANWPIFAYFPLSLLTVRWLAERWNPAWVGWVRNGVIVALIGLVVLQVPEVWGRMLPPKWHKVVAKLDELTGWRELGKKVARAASGIPIVTERHQDAAELAFYMPGQPDIWPVGDGSRRFAFDFFDPKPDFDAMDEVVFVGYSYQWFAQSHGLEMVAKQNILFRLNTGGKREVTMIFLKRPAPTSQPASSIGKRVWPSFRQVPPVPSPASASE